MAFANIPNMKRLFLPSGSFTFVFIREPLFLIFLFMIFSNITFWLNSTTPKRIVSNLCTLLCGRVTEFVSQQPVQTAPAPFVIRLQFIILSVNLTAVQILCRYIQRKR